MPHRKYLTPEILHDAPLHNRKLADFHFDEFAATLARLIANPNTETPLAIGINGAWGSGKTSLLMRVKHMLDKPNGEDGKGEHRFADADEKSFRKCKTVWFDAWKYNDEAELLVALVRVILNAMRNDGFIARLKSWYEDPKQPSYDIAAMFINAFQISFGGLGADFRFQLDPKKYEAPSKIEQHTAFFDHFNEAFERLLAVWVHNKKTVAEIDESKGALVIFIDDLDRCLPDKIVQALEALKLFLDKEGCVFVIGADISIVQRAVAKYYEDAGITGESAKDYLEKVIQLRFDLPPIVEKAMEAYLQSQDQTKVDEAMRKRWQALVAAAEVNPRRVKNVINDLNLQWYMAVNSGQAEGVNRDDFICWQALMRAAPRAFAEHVMGTLEDSERRHSFILDALKWQQGSSEDKELVKGYFSAYEDKESKRLRRVLKQVSFSAEFTPEALEAMIYMSAPPPKPEQVTPPVEERKAEVQIQAEAEKIESVLELEEPALLRRESGAARGDGNRLTVGGLDFVRVPAGKFVMGTKEGSEFDFESERPQHTIDLPYDFWMAKFILTNEQYAESLVKQEHPVKDWQKKKDHPVVSVSWNDAMAYCNWFNQTFKSELGDLLLRLPTEAEWEKAARGAYGNEWPWGNEFDPSKCNSIEGRKGGTTPVGSYSSAGGDSPYGCADMVGNVWEWTHSRYGKYPYNAKDGREDESSRDRRVLRGGSFHNDRKGARCAYRPYNGPDRRNFSFGFRLCVVPHPVSGI